MSLISEEIFKKAKHAVIDLDEQAVERVALKCLEAGINPVDLIEKGFIEGMNELGIIFEAGQIPFSQMLKAEHVVQTGINVLKSIRNSKGNVSWFANLSIESEGESIDSFSSHITDIFSSFHCC